MHTECICLDEEHHFGDGTRNTRAAASVHTFPVYLQNPPRVRLDVFIQTQLRTHTGAAVPRSFFVVPATNNGRKASNPSDQLRVVLPMVLGRALEVMVALTLEPSSVPILCLAQSLCHSPFPRICVVLTSCVGDVADH